MTHVVSQDIEALKKLKNLDTPTAAKKRHGTSALFKDVIRKADKRKMYSVVDKNLFQTYVSCILIRFESK